MKKFLLFILIQVMVISFVGCGSSDNNEDILNYVKSEVANSLKKPDTATFCDDEEFIIKELESGKFYVTGYCEGENSYGAMVGNGFNIIVSEDDTGEYSSTDVSFFSANEWKTKRDLENARMEKENNGEELLTGDKLDSQLRSQDYYIDSTKIEREEDLYLATGDMIEAVIKNNSDKTIKNAIVAFVGWDANGYPVRIKGTVDITDGSYTKEVLYSGINLEPDKTYGEDSGYEIEESLNIKTIKAIVVSVETSNGDKWENPYYVDFVEAYENKKIN